MLPGLPSSTKMYSALGTSAAVLHISHANQQKWTCAPGTVQKALSTHALHLAPRIHSKPHIPSTLPSCTGIQSALETSAAALQG